MTFRPDKPVTPPGVPSTLWKIDKPRVKLSELLHQKREIEIDHDGKIYRLRLTQSNKLILTT